MGLGKILRLIMLVLVLATSAIPLAAQTLAPSPSDAPLDLDGLSRKPQPPGGAPAYVPRALVPPGVIKLDIKVLPDGRISLEGAAEGVMRKATWRGTEVAIPRAPWPGRVAQLTVSTRRGDAQFTGTVGQGWVQELVDLYRVPGKYLDEHAIEGRPVWRVPAQVDELGAGAFKWSGTISQLFTATDRGQQAVLPLEVRRFHNGIGVVDITLTLPDGVQPQAVEIWPLSHVAYTPMRLTQEGGTWRGIAEIPARPSVERALLRLTLPPDSLDLAPLWQVLAGRADVQLAAGGVAILLLWLGWLVRRKRRITAEQAALAEGMTSDAVSPVAVWRLRRAWVDPRYMLLMIILSLLAKGIIIRKPLKSGGWALLRNTGQGNPPPLEPEEAALMDAMGDALPDNMDDTQLDAHSAADKPLVTYGANARQHSESGDWNLMWQQTGKTLREQATPHWGHIPRIVFILPIMIAILGTLPTLWANAGLVSTIGPLAFMVVGVFLLVTLPLALLHLMKWVIGRMAGKYCKPEYLLSLPRNEVYLGLPVGVIWLGGFVFMCLQGIVPWASVVLAGAAVITYKLALWQLPLLATGQAILAATETQSARFMQQSRDAEAAQAVLAMMEDKPVPESWRNFIRAMPRLVPDQSRKQPQWRFKLEQLPWWRSW